MKNQKLNIKYQIYGIPYFLFFIFYLLFSITPPAAAWTDEEIIPLDIQVFKMQALPTFEAEPTFVFPIEFKLIAMTPDHNWYKAKIVYDIPLLGHFEYAGWCYVPLGEKFFSLQK